MGASCVPETSSEPPRTPADPDTAVEPWVSARHPGELESYRGRMVDAANRPGARDFVALGLSLLAVVLTSGVGGRTVRPAATAVLGTPFVVVRAGMDHPVCTDGCGGLVGVAQWTQ